MASKIDEWCAESLRIVHYFFKSIRLVLEEKWSTTSICGSNFGYGKSIELNDMVDEK